MLSNIICLFPVTESVTGCKPDDDESNDDDDTDDDDIVHPTRWKPGNLQLFSLIVI
jgi:hypothetical protein